MDYARYAEEHHLIVEIDDRIATLTINRPEVRNAVNYMLHLAFEDIWRELSRDRDVDVVILTGAGDKAFCAGGDMKGFNAPNERAVDGLRSTRGLVEEMARCEVPVIAAVNGVAAGLGASLALLSDVIFMADTARIGDTHVNMGLVAGDGGAVIWPLLVGPHRAKEYLMAGKLLTGPEAGEIGLVNHVVPADRLMEEARAYAKLLQTKPPTAVKWTKQAINQQILQQINLTMGFGAALEHNSAGTADTREAMTAFVEKREAKFTGS